MVLLADRLQAAVERGHALRESLGAETAGLERLLVAIQRALGLGDLLGERRSALLKAGAVVVVSGGGVPDRLPE